MHVDFNNNNTAKILATHDDIALSSSFPTGNAELLDMVVDSGGTTLYVLVGNGKLHSLFKKCLKQFYSKVCVFWQQLFIIYFRLLELLF